MEWKVYGIVKGDENYLQVKWEEMLHTSKSPEDIVKDISTRDEYLGEVKFEDAIIKEQHWKGFIMSSKSEITKLENNSGIFTYSLKTTPKYNWVKIDYYYNLEYFKILKYIITDVV